MFYWLKNIDSTGRNYHLRLLQSENILKKYLPDGKK